MKRIGAMTWIASTVFAVLALTASPAAQVQQKAGKAQHYTVHDLGGLGGTFSWALGINNNGSVAGYAFLPGGTALHAFLWRKGVMTDLGTLGGPNSIVYGLSNLNDRDEVVGAADTATPDPFGEDFCFFGTNFSCVPFLWSQGVMTPLPTLGGSNGTASSINPRDQVVGTAENSTPDDCGYRAVQLKPVIWNHGLIEELPTLAGDTLGFAIGNNDYNQAVGWSRSCTAFHAVLWENGSVTYLGSLGGATSVAWSINNQGQVVAQSYLTGDAILHSFIWQKDTGMRDLGTLPGDFSCNAWGINDKGQVVGSSCDENFNCRAFVWQGGVMTDLNTLVPPGSGWFLLEADSINAAGEIVGLAFNMITGEYHAFLATLTERASIADGEAPAVQRENVAGPRLVLPESVRKTFQQHISRWRLGFVGRLPQ